MSFNSPKTKVAVILNEDGITWDGAEVNMVYIISISEKYKDEFRSIYENLMDFLSDDQKFKSILESQDLNSFYERLLS
jgi:mannitol/fructose-specific phosphotransferase system IIA component (Ntr-type)